MQHTNKYSGIKSIILFSIILFSSFFTQSCIENKSKLPQDKLLDFSLEKMSNYYKIDTIGWKYYPWYLKNYTKIIPDLQNSIIKTDFDTVYKHSFEIELNEKDTFYIPRELYKKYESEGFLYILSLGKSSDTLYFYKAALFDDLHKIFIRGKYYYKYINHELSNNQRKYFLNHYDSLIRVKGNKLQELPDVID